jgi:polysaccharide export outer membrane protein
LLVAGHSPAEIGRQVEAALSGQAITPHVMVSLQTETNRFTLSGAVKNPGLFKMDEHGVTLLDAIANAGGATNQPQDIMVQITRFGHPHLIRQQTLLDQPETNIHVRADDLIELYLQPRTYLVLGATNKVAHETLPRERLTLAEAIGKAGGLSDGRADSNSVYLFRFETRSTLERLVEIEAKLARRRGEIIPGTLDPKAARLPPETLIPVIYSVNLRSGTGIFLAHQVAVREKDMVFVPNTRSVQWQKWLGLYKESTSPITSGVIAGKGL